MVPLTVIAGVIAMIETTTTTVPGPQQQRHPERSGGEVKRAGTEDE